MFDLSVRRSFHTSSCRIAGRRRLRGEGTCLYSTRLLRARCPPLLDREDAAHDHPPPSDSLTTDYYQELGLDQDAPVSEIQDRLTVLEAQNRSRAVFKNAQGESARRSLAWIAEARQVFATEDSKDEYDIRLRRRPAQVDWTGRAWRYYHAGDYGPARIAARKAREAAPSDPRPWVVSAWIELAESSNGMEFWNNFDDRRKNKQAKVYADKALILDENEDIAVEVQEVRGVAFEAVDEPDLAVNCYRQAIRRASDTYKSQLYLRLVRAFSFNNKVTIDLCLEALVDNLTPDARRSIDGIIKSSIKSWAECRSSYDYHEYRYKGLNIKELTERIEQLNKLASQVGSLNLPVDNKRDLVSYINTCVQILDLFRLAKTLRGQSSPEPPWVVSISLPILLYTVVTAVLSLGIFPGVLGPQLAFMLGVVASAYALFRYIQFKSLQHARNRDQDRARAAEKASDELLERIRNY